MEWIDYFYCKKGRNRRELFDILGLMLDLFQDLDLDFDYEDFLIYGGTEDGNPIFFQDDETESGLCEIHLGVKDFDYWDATIFQLGHEITHAFIYFHNHDAKYYSNWIEECICEAMALFFLSYFKDCWEDFILSEINYEYDENIDNYLQDELNIVGNNKLSKCRGYEQLMHIDENSQIKRLDRNNEMLRLYELITEDDIPCLINYRDYIKPGKRILDCDKYLKAYPYSEPVKYLCNLQNKILG